jgi:hypothetical protein
VLLTHTSSYAEIKLGDLSFHAQYWPEDTPGNEHGLRLWVRAVQGEGELVSQLFQLPAVEELTNQFTGGHGFTGLSYVYHLTSGAELQYSCSLQ